MPNRAGSDRRGRRSRQRAASYRQSALHHLQRQVRGEMEERGTIRQRFNNIQTHCRGSDHYGLNVNYNNDTHTDNGNSNESDSEDRSTPTAQLRQSEMDALDERTKLAHVPRIGRLAQPRPNGVFRWMYCQVNGMAEPQSRAKKLHDIWDLAEKFDVDGIVMVEVGVNWTRFKPSARLASWFNPLSSREVRATESFNTHAPPSSRRQQGGTAIVLRHGLLQYARGVAPDCSGLGRWASWLFDINPTHRTRIIVAYCPGIHKKTGPQTVYTQHLTEINSRGLDCSPYQLFVNELREQLRCWKAAGDRLVLFIDANEHVLRGVIARMLAEPLIDMHEISHAFWDRSKEHNTHISGKQPIDGIYATPDIEAQSFLALSFHESVGDHRTSIIDITTSSMVGAFQSHIVRPTSRRLTTRQSDSVRQYNTDLWHRLSSHRIPERWQTIASEVAAGGGTTPQHIQERAQRLHTETTEHRLGAEHGCRKILKPVSPFSPPIKFWYDRIHAFQQLIRLKEGNHPRMGRSRVYRLARGKHINDPQKLSIADCKEGIRLAKIRQKEVRCNDMAHRRQHLGNCLQRAMDSGNETHIKEIKDRIRNEHSKKIWQRINRVTRPTTGRAVLQVEEERHGMTITSNDRDNVEITIQRECEDRFKLGHSAPISNTPLGEELRYMSDPKIAEQIINGTYTIPDDFDPATALMLLEIGRMGRVVRQVGHEAITGITAQDYQHYGKRIKENTSSSPSGLHHGHDKSAAQCDKLSEFFAFQMTTIIQTGLRPARWGVALQVMLEKIAGVCLVTKLRSIQLYEADYNWFNKFVFNDAAMATLSRSGCLPEEHFSQRDSTSEDACFDKTLTTDISRQSRQPMALISVDAAQCYDRVNHSMMGLVWAALNIPLQCIVIILGCLGYMKIFTRTGYGDSTRYFGGEHQSTPFCGLGQGSKAAPASWIQLSSVIVNCFKNKGFGAKIRDPITGDVCHSIGCLFVDDTDLYAMEEGRLDTEEAVIEEAQQEINWWSWFLSATGGAIKAPKSFCYFLFYVCNNGIWTYKEVDHELMVPMPEGGTVALTARKPSHAEKGLGIHTAPCGGHAAQLESLRERVDSWTKRTLNGHLPASHIWMSYVHQLGPGLQYGLGTLTNDLASAERCLNTAEYTLLPLLGINRHLKRGWRTLHQTFGGIGLIDLPVEQLICRVNILQQHYGTPSSLGRKLSVSLHWLQLQIGTTGSPFSLDYDTWSHLSPICWAKCLWEMLTKYDVGLEMNYNNLSLQRVGDRTVMDFLLPYMTTPKKMTAINRCRCYLNVLFLSDMTSLDGNSINDDFVWGSRTPLRSRMRFPPEHPTQDDWCTWVDLWTLATSTGLTLRSTLGCWITPPHFDWPWIFNYDTNELMVLSSRGYEIHRPPKGKQRTRSTHMFAPTGEITQEASGEYVSVDSITTQTTIVYDATRCGEVWNDSPAPISGFWDYIREWGGEWMWEMIYPDCTDGFDPQWLIKSLRAGSLVGVTDGSYDRNRDAYVCGAGWILMDATTGQRLAGSFSEHSSSAGSYRGELLGLCAINVILLALTKAGGITTQSPVKIWCDNKGALNRAANGGRRIKSGLSCADILRVLRTIRMELPLDVTYTHVKAHMDDYLEWDDLALENQLNCQCDHLAKTSVTRMIESNLNCPTPPTRCLPKESTAIFINNEKITSDPTKALRYRLGKIRAREFLTTEKGWSPQQFDEVAWDSLHMVLSTKPVMFRLWLSKQHSNFCATGRNMARNSQSDDDRCPSCWKAKERADHLCICPSEHRTQLFLDNVGELAHWMENNDSTSPELAYWTTKYLQGRGGICFSELGPLSPEMASLAQSQDTIGWRNMLEGRVSSHFYAIQRRYLAANQTLKMTGEDWMKGFITHLIHISHSQWLFRNFTLHDRLHGYQNLKERAEVALRLEVLSHTNPDRIPEHSRFLLEIDTEKLARSNFDTQSYWVAAMEAACGAATVAVTGRLCRPNLSKFGTFHVRESIRREMGEIFRTGNRSTSGHGGIDADVHIQQYARVPPRITGLTDSDRRRKPN